MRLIGAFLIVMLLSSAAMGSVRRTVGPPSLASWDSPAPESDSDLLPPDPQMELRHLSKDLKLRRNQRVGVGSILEERNREIRLLFDIQALSPDNRKKLAAQVIATSDGQIEALLRSKQKRKFDRELSQGRLPIEDHARQQ
jgi:hypothetical protein